MRRRSAVAGDDLCPLPTQASRSRSPQIADQASALQKGFEA